VAIIEHIHYVLIHEAIFHKQNHQLKRFRRVTISGVPTA
jgi:hypothetical protein